MLKNTFTTSHLEIYLKEKGLTRRTLKEFSVPDGVTKIEQQAFHDCTSLTSIEFPDSLAEIGFCAFYNCTSLTSIELPGSLTVIGVSAFHNCTSLRSITPPPTLSEIQRGVFWGCTSLTSIQLPISLTKIDVGAFQDCTSLTSIMLPVTLTELGYSAFSRCTSLASIKLPNSLTVIRQSAFRECSSLSSIVLPDSPTIIEELVFKDCTSLTHIEFPESLSEIKLHAFRDCPRLQYIVTNQNFDWFHLGIDTSKVQILSYLQYLEQKKPSLLEELDTHNLEPHRAYQIYKMLNDKNYLPTWDTLKDTFQNKSTTQLRSLLQELGKDMKAVDDVIPSIGITINNSPLHESIFTYMCIKDCDAIFDGSKNLNFIWQTEIKDPKDDLSEIESEQNSVESYNSTTKTHIN